MKENEKLKWLDERRPKRKVTWTVVDTPKHLYTVRRWPWLPIANMPPKHFSKPPYTRTKTQDQQQQQQKTIKSSHHHRIRWTTVAVSKIQL